MRPIYPRCATSLRTELLAAAQCRMRLWDRMRLIQMMRWPLLAVLVLLRLLCWLRLAHAGHGLC